MNRICALLNCEHPIVQTGMGWVATPALVTAVSEAGGFGILAGATLSLPELDAAIGAIKELTARNFGVNLRADAPDAQQRVECLIRHKVHLASFAAAPQRSLVDELKDAGVAVMPTVGKRRHAEKVAEWGVDAVIAQGHEGGGHTGPVASSLLLPDVVDAVDIPVLAAGGFRCGRGLVAAQAFGAAGIAMGTRFLLTAESPVPTAVKRAYLAASLTDTRVSARVDGHPQRLLTTDFVNRLEDASPLARLWLALRSGLAFKRMTGVGFWSLLAAGLRMKRDHHMTLAQAIAAANAPMLTRRTMVDGDLDAGILPSGQVAGLIDDIPTAAALIARIIAEARTARQRIETEA